MFNGQSDGLGMLPRPGEPESALVPGMAAAARQDATRALIPVPPMVLPQAMPDSSIGPVALQTPVTWTYDFDPGTGSARATFNGQVAFTSGGAAGSVASFNGRTGAVTLQASDVTGVGGLANPSPALAGVPTTPTAAVGTSTTQIASTAYTTAQIASALANSPALGGSPTAPNQVQGSNNTLIANTAYVDNQPATGTGAMVRQANATINTPALNQPNLNNTGMNNQGMDVGVGMYIYHISGTNYAGIGCAGDGSVVTSGAAEFYWAPSGGNTNIMHLTHAGLLYIAAGQLVPSAAALKRDINTLEPSDYFDKLRPVSFRHRDKRKGSGIAYGLIAEEVQKIAPEFVGEGLGTLGVNYQMLIAELIAQVQQLKSEVAKLSAPRRR